MRARPNILVVEDDFAFRDGVVDALVDAGHAVAAARDGYDALRALDRLTRPALIFLDLQMPLLDGVGFLHELKNRPDRLEFEVVVMSAMVASEWFDRFPGVIRALRKPFDVTEILTLAAEFVDRHAAPSAAGFTAVEQSAAILGPSATVASPRKTEAQDSFASSAWKRGSSRSES
jgi:two-component system, chemotaxis family, chemotaxis protein CheY